ncbi:hypothetical protein GCM10007890_36050 [Methylobacterium tardum]|uniref:Uncharacterized protein n=1 Tax=Methylobacterium tardum TaxID=374432 RepID=A0AA37WTZ0_9HYPH|nr:hypothetical protein GCM10007890_36050 [Methylobacterium tardum]
MGEEALASAPHVDPTFGPQVPRRVLGPDPHLDCRGVIEAGEGHLPDTQGALAYRRTARFVTIARRPPERSTQTLGRDGANIGLPAMDAGAMISGARDRAR